MIAVLVNSLAGGGAERVALTILEELKLQSHEVILICLEQEKGYPLPTDTSVIYLTKFEKLTNPFFKVFWIFVSAFRLSRYIQQHNISLVQSHLIRSNFINTAAKIFGAKHRAQIVSHLPVHLGTLFPLLQIKRAFYQWLYSKADQVVSISEVMKLGIDQALRFKPNQIDHIVIHNPHDIESIQKLAKDQVDDFSFRPDKKYIISVGRQLRHKRVEVIIKALSIVRTKLLNVELIVIGEGEDQGFFQAVAKQNNLEPFVHFLGHRPNPFAYLSRSDIFILSSEKEGLPNIIIESLVCGVSVISSDCISGPREILSPGSDFTALLQDKIEYAKYGVLYPIERADLLAKAIVKVLSGECLGNGATDRAQTYVCQYDKKTITSKYIDGFYSTESKVKL